MFFLRKFSFTGSTSDMIMTEVLKLNEEEHSKLNFDYDSHEVMQKKLSSSTVLDFKKNDMLDDLCLENMDMHC